MTDTGVDPTVDNVLGQQVMGDFRPGDLVATAGTHDETGRQRSP